MADEPTHNEPLPDESLPNDPSIQDAPLTIEGFRYERKLGSFALGDSFQYLQLTKQRHVHVLLAHQVAPLDTFIAEFRTLIGDLADGMLLYAGVTDKDRPYLVTTFLDENEPVDMSIEHEESDTAPEDQTILSSRSGVSDDTVLVDRDQNDDLTLLVTRSAQPQQSPSVWRPRGNAQPLRVRAIPTLVVSEREPHVPDPSAPAAVPRYAPRSLPSQHAATQVNATTQGPRTTQAPVSRARREQRRARVALVAFGLSIILSIVGASVILLSVFAS